MFYTFYILLIPLLISIGDSYKFMNKFLSKSQWSLIDKLLLNPNTTKNMRNKIHYILYKYYDQWAFTKAYQFKQFHKYKCNHISTSELYNYASYGLYKSIKKYNVTNKNSFLLYAEKNIHYELLKGITDLHPITSIPKTERKKGYKQDIKKVNSKTQLIGDNEWIYDKINKYKIEENDPLNQIVYKDKYISLWNKIDELKPFHKRIMYLKYNFYFQKIRSNKEIGELMGFSEEWIRQNIVILSSFLSLNLSHNN